MILTIFIFIDLLIVLAFAFTPYVTRKTELFGVSLPSSQTHLPELNKMRAAFRNISLMIGVVFIGLTVLVFYLFKNENAMSVAYTVLLFIDLIVTFFVYLVFHKRMKQFKHAQGWDTDEAKNATLIVDTSAPANDTQSTKWLWLYVVIAALTVFIIWRIWPIVPDKIVMHMDLAGNVDRWVDKGLGAVFTVVFTQWFLLAIFAGTFFIVKYSKRQIDAAQPELSRIQAARFRKIMSGSLYWGGVIMGVLMGAMQIMMLLNVDMRLAVGLPIAILVIAVVFVVVLYLKVGQGGSRLKVGKASSTKDANPDNDKYWKLGQFYVNKNDPSIFVEQRFGIGYTCNWAHPISWLLLIGLFVLVGVLIWLSVKFAS
ncbi:MAG: DUF5808 domain-containing protein [Clostridiales Family XIII bacterium]|jgi:uncharacterized membrane protein|nr:DUF5808 domain-containing protein [Clostridiales Family XIII bacterium]